jgi:hypothetical protein
MSHFSRINTAFVEEKYLLAAIKDLGYEYETGKQKIRAFGGTQADADIKIKLRFSYDIGLKKTDKNQYQVIADWFGVKGISQKKFMEQLTQRYAYQATVDKLTNQGFSLIEEQTEKGEIKMVLRRMVS